VIEIRDDDGVRMGTVRFAGVTRDVCLDCQPDAAVGDYVLVHVGFAIAKIDREEAERALRVLLDIGQADEVLS
jgi:hydrogenase expression/formation protein HypC